MCTVTWRFDERGGFDLFSNRDERRSRLAALPPRLLERGGTALLAPLDGDAGGSWIGVNEYGLAATLLNLYELESAFEPTTKPVSRGVLLLDQLAARSLGQVAEALATGELESFLPFVLLALAPGEGALVVRWNGDRVQLEERGPAGLLSSSGHDAAAAERARWALLEEMVANRGWLDASLLEDFHRSHRPERGPLSPCMHRSEARTVSFTHARVGTDELSLAYAPGPPCRTPVGAVATLERRPPRRSAGGGPDPARH